MPHKKFTDSDRVYETIRDASGAVTFEQIYSIVTENRYLPRQRVRNLLLELEKNKKAYKGHEKIEDEDSALSAAKRGKNTSMWLAIESVRNKSSDIIVSAGNTGALFIIAKLNLKMIENIDKPALSALWPNKKGMSVVLDLGANVECNDKNLVDFAIMGSSLHKSLYPDEKVKVALLNIGSEEIKGNETIKKAYQSMDNNDLFSCSWNVRTFFINIIFKIC